jgi:hypothetical protein
MACDLYETKAWAKAAKGAPIAPISVTAVLLLSRWLLNETKAWAKAAKGAPIAPISVTAV